MSSPSSPAHSIPEADGAYTHITRNDDGEITQLDTYSPEIPENTHFSGIDFMTLQRTHPYARLAGVNQHVDVNESGASVIGMHGENVHVSSLAAFQAEATQDGASAHVSVKINPAYIIYPPNLFSMNGEGIVVNQRLGAVRSGAVAVAVSLDK